MTRFVGLMDGNAGAYGISFPDAPGCVAMGKTVNEALKNASEAIIDWLDGGEPVAFRTIDQLREDPEVIEQLADGAAFVVVSAVVEEQ